LVEPFLFEVSVTRRGHLAVAGQIDLDTAPILRRALAGALAELAIPPALVVDLSAVDFIDAAGIGVLVGVANRARRAGGGMALRAPSPTVVRVLALVGLTGAFPLVD
jgi:anti-anti-sigma factor